MVVTLLPISGVAVAGCRMWGSGVGDTPACQPRPRHRIPTKLPITTEPDLPAKCKRFSADRDWGKASCHRQSDRQWNRVNFWTTRSQKGTKQSAPRIQKPQTWPEPTEGHGSLQLCRPAHRRLTAQSHRHKLCSCLTLSGIPRLDETGNSRPLPAAFGTPGSGCLTLPRGLAKGPKGPEAFCVLVRKERIKFTLLQIHINLNLRETCILLMGRELFLRRWALGLWDSENACVRSEQILAHASEKRAF